MKRLTFIFLGLALWAADGQAQDVLTLDEAMASALSNNLNIKIAQNQERIGENNATRGNAGALPDVVASGNYSGSLTNTRLVFAGNAQPPIEVDGAQSATLSGGVTVNYNLFNGFLATNTYSRLQGQRELASIEGQMQIENVLTSLINAYHLALQIQENLATAQESMDISRRRYQRAQLRAEYGSATSIALLNAQVDLQNDSINVFMLSQQLENAMNNLAYLMGTEVAQGQRLANTMELSVLEQKDAFLTKATSQNLRILQARQSQKISESEVAVSKAGFYPRLSLQAAYQYSNNQSDANFVIENQSVGLNGGIGLSYSIFNGGRAQIQRENAEVLWENAQLRKDDAVRQLTIEIDNAYLTHQNNLALLELRETALRANERNFQRSEELFKNGQITGTEFREAQLNYIQATTQLSLAKISAKLSEYELMRLSGQLVSNWEN